MANSFSTTTTTSTLQSAGVLFRWDNLFKSAAFGGTIGAITGSVFGFMDSMRLAGQSEVSKNASNAAAKAKYIMVEGTTHSATLFGIFSSGFHVVKYGIRVALDPGEYSKNALAGGISLGALNVQAKFLSIDAVCFHADLDGFYSSGDATI
jgi:hypothetical protein